MSFSSFFLVSVNRPYKTDSVPYYSGVVTPRNTFSTFFRCGFQKADNLTTSQETHQTDITKSARPDSFCTFKMNGNTGWLISHVSKQDSLHKYIFVFEMTLKSSLSVNVFYLWNFDEAISQNLWGVALIEARLSTVFVGKHTLHRQCIQKLLKINHPITYCSLHCVNILRSRNRFNLVDALLFSRISKMSASSSSDGKQWCDICNKLTGFESLCSQIYFIHY